MATDASPAQRGRGHFVRERERGTLEQLTRGRDTSKYLQDDVVTERNGRFVVRVRAEHRSHVPGIVHGGSATGATLLSTGTLSPVSADSSACNPFTWNRRRSAGTRSPPCSSTTSPGCTAIDCTRPTNGLNTRAVRFSSQTRRPLKRSVISVRGSAFSEWMAATWVLPAGKVTVVYCGL